MPENLKTVDDVAGTLTLADVMKACGAKPSDMKALSPEDRDTLKRWLAEELIGATA